MAICKTAQFARAALFNMPFRKSVEHIESWGKSAFNSLMLPCCFWARGCAFYNQIKRTDLGKMDSILKCKVEGWTGTNASLAKGFSVNKASGRHQKQTPPESANSQTRARGTGPQGTRPWEIMGPFGQTSSPHLLVLTAPTFPGHLTFTITFTGGRTSGVILTGSCTEDVSRPVSLRDHRAFACPFPPRTSPLPGLLQQWTWPWRDLVRLRKRTRQVESMRMRRASAPAFLRVADADF